MIKVSDKYAIKKDLHGWLLLEKTIATKRETGDKYEKYNSTFHANLDQVAQKIIHESSENVCGDLDDLRVTWLTCVQEIKKYLEGKL